MNSIGIKATSLTLMWMLFLSIFMEAGAEGKSLPLQKSIRDAKQRSYHKASVGNLPTINNQSSGEEKGSHKSQDHRDEDEEEYNITSIPFTNIFPIPFLFERSTPHRKAGLFFSICCRRN